MQALVTGDAEAFYTAETEARRDADAPPFGRYAAIIVSSEDQGAAQSAANMIARAAPRWTGCMSSAPRLRRWRCYAGGIGFGCWSMPGGRWQCRM
ncbi:hypothetical protein GCM10020258_26500 [Sphingomonas yabuuchiae]